MNRIIKSINTDFAVISLLENNIGHVHFKPNIEINQEIQFQLLDCYKELTNKPIPFIYSSDEFLASSDDAPETARSVEQLAPISMKVLVVQNLAQRILAKFYYKKHQPINPYTICSSFDEALTWINNNRMMIRPSA